MNVRRYLLIGAFGAAALGLVPAGLAVAATHSTSTTIKFVATTTAQKVSSTEYLENGTENSGGVIGYYTLSCQPTTGTAYNCGGGGSFAKGMLYFKFPLSTTSKTFSGTVTGGTGAYAGAKGTISGKQITSKQEAITIVLS